MPSSASRPVTLAARIVNSWPHQIYRVDLTRDCPDAAHTAKFGLSIPQREHCWASQQWHPARDARKRTRAKKEFGRRGSPRIGEAVLDCEKKGLASVRGTRSHDAAGQHRLTIQPGEWSGARCPRLRPARSLRIPNSAHYRPARVSRENTRDQRRARPGRTAEAVSPPRAKKNPRRTLTSRSTEMKSAYDTLSESAECDCR